MIIVNDQSNTNYDVGNEVIYNPEVLKTNLCDYNGACILVRNGITIAQDNRTQIAFKDYALFISSITKIDETTIDDAKDWDLVMPIYNLLKYSLNYSVTRSNLGLIQKMKQLPLLMILQTVMLLNL